MAIAPPKWHHFEPVPAPTDRRWLAIKDRITVPKRVSPPLIRSADRWVYDTVRYVRDHGDEWADPATTWARGFGDCEDIALLKRAVLINSGLNPKHIFLVLVRDLIAKADHALLVAFEDCWRVLDSYNSLSLPIEKVSDYRPIIAFNGDDAWTYGIRRARP